MKLLTFPDLKAAKGIPYSRQHILRLEQDGKFPKRIPLGAGRHGWLDHEIDEYITACAAERDEMASS
jgi:prophage regulatory protein